MPGAEILDLACGYGRLSIPLARRGYRVTGFDFSEPFLDLARREAGASGVDVTFVRGDMRHLDFEDRFDAVLNIFTSFGYFETTEEDLGVLRRIRRGLKEGGALLLDFVNAPRVIGRLQDRGQVDEATGELVVESVETLSNGLEVHQVDRLDADARRWRMRRWWAEEGRERSYDTDIRMYHPAELQELMRKAGLEVAEVWGDFDANPYREDSPRVVIRATRQR